MNLFKSHASHCEWLHCLFMINIIYYLTDHIFAACMFTKTRFQDRTKNLLVCVINFLYFSPLTVNSFLFSIQLRKLWHKHFSMPKNILQVLELPLGMYFYWNFLFENKSWNSFCFLYRMACNVNDHINSHKKLAHLKCQIFEDCYKLAKRPHSSSEVEMKIIKEKSWLMMWTRIRRKCGEHLITKNFHLQDRSVGSLHLRVNRKRLSIKFRWCENLSIK